MTTNSLVTVVYQRQLLIRIFNFGSTICFLWKNDDYEVKTV